MKKKEDPLNENFGYLIKYFVALLFLVHPLFSLFDNGSPD